jgi:hypothetical protein
MGATRGPFGPMSRVGDDYIFRDHRTGKMLSVTIVASEPSPMRTSIRS